MPLAHDDIAWDTRVLQRRLFALSPKWGVICEPIPVFGFQGRSGYVFHSRNSSSKFFSLSGIVGNTPFAVAATLRYPIFPHAGDRLYPSKTALLNRRRSRQIRRFSVRYRHYFFPTDSSEEHET